MPKKKSKQFKMEKGYFLFVQEIDGAFFLLWGHEKDPIASNHWIKTSDNKILLPVATIEQAKAFIASLGIMFNVDLENVSKKFPSCAFAVQIF